MSIVSIFRVMRACTRSHKQIRSLCAGKAPSFEMKKVKYELPTERIGLEPKARGESKLLHVTKCDQGGENILNHFTFKDVVGLIPRDAHMIYNNSRVLPARLWMGDGDGEKPTEIMLLQPVSPESDPAVAVTIPGHGQIWTAMLRGGVTEVRPDMVFASASGVDKYGFKVKIVHVDSIWEEKNEEPGFEVAVMMETEEEQREVILEDCLASVGDIPIPPYLDRATTSEDNQVYQTVYSNKTKQGSVAAPTAGLHFDDTILKALKDKGVTSSFVSLHVGAGTFKPVSSDNISDHDMHSERFSVTQEQVRQISQASARGQPLVCVGTTSVRLGETLYWCGVKEILGMGVTREGADLHLGQWDYVEIEKTWSERYPSKELPTLNSSLDALLASTGPNADLAGCTSLCITPSYNNFRICNHGLITNFHQAESTLLLLVSAFLGEEGNPEAGVSRIKDVYKQALDKNYRFLSYGDSMLIQK